jgi:ATP-binding cassette, subfamily A (ABC1), member 3
LIWADGTNGTGIFTAQDIMNRITQDFQPYQLKAVKQVNSPSQIPKTCPQNFNLFSECFAAVQFDYIPQQEKSSESVKYTIRADGGLFHVDVVRHTGDFEKRILPLQWAVDKAIMELTINTNTSTPLEWPFTIATNAEQYRDIRLSKLRVHLKE